MVNSVAPTLPSTAERRATGRAARKEAPRSTLATLTDGARDPLGIIAAQNATRQQDLVPLRIERMAASAFAFYRGTAALMAADLAAGASSGIQVASCGDAHVSNFGFYASPQRTLVFDLNDFDESAWAPWEWDLKRLVTSLVIAGQSAGRDDAVTKDAAEAAVRQYVRSLRESRRLTPLARYYEHFDAEGGLATGSKASRKVLRDAISHAQRRTSERAMRKITTTGDDGRLRFVEEPPTMTHIGADRERALTDALRGYLVSTRPDIRLLLAHYEISDTVRRVVGVGSVGTRCFVSALVDGDGHGLLMQTKEAARSVLIQYGERPQPGELTGIIDADGEGARVVVADRDTANVEETVAAITEPRLSVLRELPATVVLPVIHLSATYIETADKVAGLFVPAVIGIAVLAFIAWAIWGPAPSLSYGLVAAVAVLIAALKFLRQPLPESWQDLDLPLLLSWAIEHWRLENVPRQEAIPLDENTPAFSKEPW